MAAAVLPCAFQCWGSPEPLRSLVTACISLHGCSAEVCFSLFVVNYATLVAAVAVLCFACKIWLQLHSCVCRVFCHSTATSHSDWQSNLLALTVWPCQSIA